MTAAPETPHQVIARVIGVSPERVTDTAHLARDLGADSLDLVELIFELEERFDAVIDMATWRDDDPRWIVGNLLAALDRDRAARASLTPIDGGKP